MNNASKIEKLLWFRGTQLELTKISLRLYAKYKDKFFLDHAKEFGARSLEIKKTLKKYE